MCLPKSEHEFIVKFDEELFEFLKSGKKIKIKNVAEMEFFNGDKNGEL